MNINNYNPYNNYNHIDSGKCLNKGIISYKGVQQKHEMPVVEPMYFSAFDKSPLKILTYTKPVKLSKALKDIIVTKELDKCIVGEKEVIKQFIEDLPPKILNRKITKLSGYGTSAIVFDLADGKVLKITQGNHFPLNRPVQNFDVPIYQKGHKNKTYYYIQEKLFQYNMPKYYTQIVTENISNAGFEPYDLGEWAPHQIGLSKDGNLYLIDSECARYKTIFHAIYDKLSFGLKRLKRQLFVY